MHYIASSMCFPFLVHYKKEVILMKRGKKFILLAHCILNCNTKVEGLSTYPSGICSFVTELLLRGYGIIQLPCIEMEMLGIKRWGVIKKQLDYPAFREKSRELLRPVVHQVVNYTHNGYTFAGILGINGSPTCGVEFTCTGNHWGGELSDRETIKNLTSERLNEKDIMMEELEKMLIDQGIEVNIWGLDESRMEESIKELLDLIG